MKINKNGSNLSSQLIGGDFFERFWEKSWTHIKTIVDVLRESILILDKDLNVIAANETFYRTFVTTPKDVEGKMVYKIGNGQWDIPALRKFLEDVSRENTFFKGFQVAHDFPSIGRKVMILNARQIHIKDEDLSEVFPPIIVLAMEDVTEMMVVAETLANRAKQLETKFFAQTQELETQIKKLEKELHDLKKRS